MNKRTALIIAIAMVPAFTIGYMWPTGGAKTSSTDVELAPAVAFDRIPDDQTTCTYGTPENGMCVARIEEDQPGWNCQTMGNRICGPVSSTAQTKGRDQ